MMTHHHVKTKRERSPSPILSSREPRTSGVRLVQPIPPECHKTAQNFIIARKQWVQKEMKHLLSKGLKVEKVLVR